MGKLIKNNLANFLVIVVITVLVASGIFYYLTIISKGAESQEIKILPTIYSGSWQNSGAALNQDLGQEAGFEEFNKENSAHPFEIAEVKPAQTPTESAIEAGPPACETCGGEEIVTESEEQITSPSEEPIFEETASPSEEPIVPPVEENPLSPSEPFEETPASPSETSQVSYILGALLDLVASESEVVSSESMDELIIEEEIATGSGEIISEEPIIEETPLDTEDPTGQVATESEPIYVPLVPLDELEQVATEGEEEEISEIQSPIMDFAPGFIESVLEFSDFGIPEDAVNHGRAIKNIQLRLSLAFENGGPQDSLIIEYTYDSSWHLLAEYFLSDPNSNATNNGYWLYALPIFKKWDDLNNLKVRFRYRGTILNPMAPIGERNQPTGLVYLDAIWLEAEYGSIEAEETQIATQIDAEIELLSDKKSFKLGEEPEFEFKYKRKRNILEKSTIGVVDLFRDEYKDIIVQVVVLGPDGEEISQVSPHIEYQEEGEFSVDLTKSSREFKPGKYKLKIIIEDSDGTFTQQQDFLWGVLAINTNKSIYLSGEEAYLQMAALKDDGHTICDAKLKLEITSPDGGTISPDVQQSGKCGSDNVTDVPDYFAYYQVGGVGIYQMKLTNLDNGYEITDSFEVRDYVPFDIERIGPTRIYPPATYAVKLKIKANQRFQGEVREYVPLGFKIITPVATSRVRSEDKLEIIWQNINWRAGETYELEYQFDAPDISPYLYLLGPLEFYEQIE